MNHSSLCEDSCVNIKMGILRLQPQVDSMNFLGVILFLFGSYTFLFFVLSQLLFGLAVPSTLFLA